MQPRGQRQLHPRQVARRDPDSTARFAPLAPDDDVEDRARRHRRPTIRMDATEIERVVAESVPTPPRTRLARGSNQIEITPPPELWLPADDAIDAAALLLPFRARRPWLATALTMALAAGLILALHHIISAG